jgi:hypothetical protein
MNHLASEVNSAHIQYTNLCTLSFRTGSCHHREAKARGSEAGVKKSMHRAHRNSASSREQKVQAGHFRDETYSPSNKLKKTTSSGCLEID